jgi:hypothetical protein
MKITKEQLARVDALVKKGKRLSTGYMTYPSKPFQALEKELGRPRLSNLLDERVCPWIDPEQVPHDESPGPQIVTAEFAAAALVSAFGLEMTQNLLGGDGEKCTEALMTMFGIKQARAEQFLLDARSKLGSGAQETQAFDVAAHMLRNI